MASTISIPIDAHLVTICINRYEIITRQIQVGRTTRPQRERVQATREFGPRQNRAGVERAIARANEIFARADITFSLRSLDEVRALLPGESEVVNAHGFFFLAGHHPARQGVSALFVSRFENAGLGGQSVEESSVCIVGSFGHPLTGNVLAHELGHLLNLAHEEQGPEARNNLMWPGLNAAQNITDAQIARARTSRLATDMQRISATAQPVR